MRTCVLVASLLVTSAFGRPAVGQEKKDGSDPAEIKGLKLPFPDVAGWERQAPKPLPPVSNGYSVGYNSQGRTAVTVFVYNRGLDKIPDDLAAEVVQREMAGAKDAVLQAKKVGLYEEVRQEKEGEATLGGRKEGRKALYVRFRVSLDKKEALSEIYVLPYRNHFLKVRITRSSANVETEKPALDKLFAALEGMLAK